MTAKKLAAKAKTPPKAPAPVVAPVVVAPRTVGEGMSLWIGAGEPFTALSPYLEQGWIISGATYLPAHLGAPGWQVLLTRLTTE